MHVISVLWGQNYLLIKSLLGQCPVYPEVWVPYSHLPKFCGAVHVETHPVYGVREEVSPRSQSPLGDTV